MEPKRKINRLTEYDYAQSGAYFITICTHGRQKILWDSNTFTEAEDVGASIARPQHPPALSEAGKIVEQCIFEISDPLSAHFGREICGHAKPRSFVAASPKRAERATNGRPYSLYRYTAV